MRPTPNQIIHGVRELLRTDIGPELKSERALRSLRKIMASLRDIDWNEIGFQLGDENATLKMLAGDVVAWIGGTDGRNAAYRLAATALQSAVAAPSRADSFAHTREVNLALRAALAAFIEAAAQRQTSGDEREATVEIRECIATALAALLV